jgi:hypothetical protein
MEADMGFDFGPEIFKDIVQGRAGGLAEAAVRHLNQVFAQVGKHVQVSEVAFAVGNVGQDFESALGTDAAGIAFTAAFVAEEIEEDAGHIDHAGILIANQKGA